MTKKKIHPFFKILIILFIFYTFLYTMMKTGYYEKKVRDKTFYTQNKIIEFEQDLKDHKDVDIINYMPVKKDYSNFFTKSANKINNKISDIMSNESKDIWSFIKALFIG